MGYFFWDPIPRSKDDQTRIAAFITALLAAQDELSELQDVNIPSPADGEALLYEAATSKWVAGPAAGVPGEGHISIIPISYNSIGQGTWVIFTWTSQALNLLFYNSTAADGDNISYKVYLDAGTYTLAFFSAYSPDAAIVDFDIDAVEVASFDCYAAGDTPNQRDIQTGIAIASAGLKTLRMRADGHNPSSSAYKIKATYIALWRTA